MSARHSSSIAQIRTVARREVDSLLHHPQGYVLLVVFLSANAFFFFRQVFLDGTAGLRQMMDLLPWLFLIFVPAVSMRSLAEDTRSGMLELVLAHPLSEVELLLGKFAGAVAFLWIGLALTFPIPLGLALGADLHWGPIVGQYLGSMLLAASLAAVGLWASSVSRTQITAFILGVTVTFLLLLVGLDPLLVGLPPTPAAVAAKLGVLAHFHGIGRGVIDLRDIVYFVSLAAVFLMLAYGTLTARRLAPARPRARQLRVAVVLMVAIVIVTNLLGGYISGRADLTPGNAYTLSPTSKTIVRGLKDIVTIKVYASRELPTSAALLKRELDDMLRDFRAAAGGKLRVIVRDPATDSTVMREAARDGIGPVQFNTVGESELQVKQGYLGLAVQYGGTNVPVGYVDRTDDLEYRIVTAIRNLTRAKKPVLAVVDEQPTTGKVLELIGGELENIYEVRDISLADPSQPAEDVTVMLLVSPPARFPPDIGAKLTAYFKRGGAVFMVMAGNEVNPRSSLAFPRQAAWNGVANHFGLAVRADIVYDLTGGAEIPVADEGGTPVRRRYPFFINARSTQASVVNKGLPHAMTTYPSTIDTSRAGLWTVTPLLVTSQNAGASTDPVSTDVMADPPRIGLQERLLAVQVSPRIGGADANHGRAIVVGTRDFLRPEVLRNSPVNFAFLMNGLDWLSQDDALIAIRSKLARPPMLAYSSPVIQQLVKYVNMIGVPALVAIAGLVHLTRRRRRTLQTYRRLTPALTPTVP